MKKLDKLTYLSLFYELFLEWNLGRDNPNRPMDLQLVSAPVDKGKEGRGRRVAGEGEWEWQEEEAK